MDDLDRELSELGERDVDDWRRERIRRISHETLRRAPRRRAARAWHRFLEPALLTLVVAGLLAWAVYRVAGLLLGE